MGSWQVVADKVPDMLDIMFDVMTDANLDSQQRVVEMLKESKVPEQNTSKYNGLTPPTNNRFLLVSSYIFQGRYIGS